MKPRGSEWIPFTILLVATIVVVALVVKKIGEVIG